MNMLVKRFAVAALAAASLVATVAPSVSSAFFGWRVSGVAKGDLLNVRAYPSSGSRILVGYPNGTRLSLTGRCTNGINLDDLGGQSAWHQQQEVRYSWCEAWLDPDGDGEFRNGWVYGRYIKPL